MYELEIQKYLRAHGGSEAFPKLETDYGIVSRQSGRHPNLWLFKYDQIASPFGELIVRECRGLILDADDDWRIVSFPFTKFFNHGEGLADQIHWPTASVQEKLDGSLAVLYWYANAWHMQTSGSPDASGNVNANNLTFEAYFWSVLGDRMPRAGAEHWCFFFELTGPMNRIVVPHAEAKLTILGGRDLRTHQEAKPEYVAREFFSDVDHVRSFPLGTIDGIIESFGSMNPLHQEGYVVCDHAFRRIKVKHPGYVALHHAKDGMTEKAFVDIARAGEVSEVIAAFPEFQQQLDAVRVKVEALANAIDVDFAMVNAVVGPDATQKDFALYATKFKYSAAMFALRGHKATSGADYLKNASQSWVLKALGMKDS